VSDLETLGPLVQAVRGRIVREGSVITGIDCGWSIVTDGDLERFPSIPSVEYIDLQKTSITDRGLRCLSKYPALVDLFLSETSVSGVGIPEVTATALKQLRLSRCLNLTNDTIPFIVKCHSLEKLFLDETKITDIALSYIARVPSLIWLSVEHTAVTDEGIMQLRNLPRLKHLCIRYTGVTQEGFWALHKALPSLVPSLHL
jgi:internalin A